MKKIGVNINYNKDPEGKIKKYVEKVIKDENKNIEVKFYDKLNGFNEICKTELDFL